MSHDVTTQSIIDAFMDTLSHYPSEDARWIRDRLTDTIDSAVRLGRLQAHAVYAGHYETLRDEFAKAALPALLAENAGFGAASLEDDANTTATLAYKFADAMLAERLKLDRKIGVADLLKVTP